jgi:hypothetical protein
MLIMPTCVVLLVPISSSWENLPSQEFYQDYFFNPQWGLAGYWLEQTGGSILLQGEVIGWIPFVSEPKFDVRPFDNGPEIIKAVEIAVNAALSPVPSDSRLYFNASAFVFVIAPPPANMGVPGKTFAGNCTLMSPGDPFDFIAHEMGHQLGLNHSFDMSGFGWGGSNRPGEYGNPYCIMSALTFGRDAGSDDPPAWVPDVRETRHYGPGLSVATRASRGWIPATQTTAPTSGQLLTFMLSSAGDPQPAHARALLVTSRTGRHHVLSYRVPSDFFDASISQPALVLEEVDGGRADANYPGLSGATILAAAPLPVDFGLFEARLSSPDFDVDVVEWQEGSSGYVMFRLTPSRSQPPQPRLLTPSVQELSSEIVDKGVANLAKGEVLCVEGSYPWFLLYRQLAVELVIDVSSLNAPDVQWSINGRSLDKASGTEGFTYQKTTAFPPAPYGHPGFLGATIDYERPGSDRLIVKNRPADGNYELKVVCTVRNSAGAGTLGATVIVEGQRMVMDPKFEVDLEGCLAKRDIDRKGSLQRRILSVPELWAPHDPTVQPKVDRLLRLMSISNEEELGQLQAELKRVTSRVSLPLRFEAFPKQAQVSKPRPLRFDSDVSGHQ